LNPCRFAGTIDLNQNYFIKKVNFERIGKRWNTETIAVKFSLLPDIGTGDMNGNFTINFKSGDYRYAVAAHQFDVNIMSLIRERGNVIDYQFPITGT